MVAIPTEALLTPREAPKVPLGRLRTVGLQRTFEAEDSLDAFLHVAITMKAIVRGNGRASDTKVNPDRFSIRGEWYIRQFDHDVEEEHPFAVDEISSRRGLTDRISSVPRNPEHHLNSSASGGYFHNALLPFDAKSMQVKAWWTNNGLRASGLHPLLLDGYCGLHSTSRLLPSLNMRIRHQMGEGCLTVTIGQMVQLISITFASFPTHAAHHIERFGKLAHRFVQSFGLFFGWPERDADRSIHIRIMPYTNQYLQAEGQ